jgi:glycosyltransferase involved in cell wall biosynthesis
LRICFIADERSPIAAAWIRFFVAGGHDTYVISSRLRVLPKSAESLHVSIASRNDPSLRPAASTPIGAKARTARWLTSELRGGKLAALGTLGSGIVGITSTYARMSSVRRLIDEIQPDLVHALRIPFEGILAAFSARRMPLLLSVWGNDFTLHAARNPAISALTRRALRRADALHCDCSRDLRMAVDLGFDIGRPSIVLPGGGGVSDVFLEAGATRSDPCLTQSPVVVNPRGLRGYVRNDSFFKAIPLVLQAFPDARFLCMGMRGEPVANRWVEKLGIRSAVDLLPVLSTTDLAACFARADVSVSPSEHDGTPNSLLEAMAAGAFPVVGALDSVQEWITDGYNGLLCDSGQPNSIAAAVIRGLEDVALRSRAKTINARLIDEKARYVNVMPQVEGFYGRIGRKDRSPTSAGRSPSTTQEC